jgi:hypothetical protein
LKCPRGGAETTSIFFASEPPAAGGTPQTPINRDSQAAGRLLPVPAAHSAGLFIIARGTCCEARACSKPRGAKARSSFNFREVGDRRREGRRQRDGG